MGTITNVLLRIFYAIFGRAMPMDGVDAAKKLDELAAKHGGRLNWRESIVDLLKVLDLDPSLDARKELADELGYDGHFTGTAEQNVWLHREVMRKVQAGKY